MLVPARAFAVEGGTEDRKTASAIAIAAGSPSAPDVRCSGTLVAPNVVLTVRHCVAEVPTPLRTCDVDLGAVSESIKDFWVTAAPWTKDVPWKRVREARVPQPTKICGNDVALLVLEEDFDESEAAVATPVTTSAAFESAAKNRVLGIAAFGATSITGTDRGTRRSRWDVPIRCVPGDPSFACGAELDYIDVREFTAGNGPCPGDSGAGAFVPTDRTSVFGILSRGNLETSCAEGVFVRTDVWAWLIARTVLDARPGVAPAWATALFPEAPRAGEFCHGAGSCGASAECISLDGTRSWTCADRCSAGACSADHHCENGLCLPGAPSSAADDGCSAAPGSRVNGAPLVVLALVLLATRARKRQ